MTDTQKMPSSKIKVTKVSGDSNLNGFYLPLRSAIQIHQGATTIFGSFCILLGYLFVSGSSLTSPNSAWSAPLSILFMMSIIVIVMMEHEHSKNRRKDPQPLIYGYVPDPITGNMKPTLLSPPQLFSQLAAPWNKLQNPARIDRAAWEHGDMLTVTLAQDKKLLELRLRLTLKVMWPAADRRNTDPALIEEILKVLRPGERDNSYVDLLQREVVTVVSNMGGLESFLYKEISSAQKEELSDRLITALMAANPLKETPEEGGVEITITLHSIKGTIESLFDRAASDSGQISETISGEGTRQEVG